MCRFHEVEAMTGGEGEEGQKACLSLVACEVIRRQIFHECDYLRCTLFLLFPYSSYFFMLPYGLLRSCGIQIF